MRFSILLALAWAEQCNDTCTWAHDGVCQDRTAPSYGSRRLTLGFKYCEPGTDCTDCYGAPADDDSKPPPKHNNWEADAPIAIMSFLATLLIGVLVLWSKRRNDPRPSVATLERAVDHESDAAPDEVVDDLEDGLGDISLKVYSADDDDDDDASSPAVYKLLI